MPFIVPFIPWIISGLFALIAGATVIDDIDQRNKRSEEQQRFRREEERLSTRISELEAVHSKLSAQIGEKNNQVRAMAEEIMCLHEERDSLRRRAAA